MIALTDVGRAFRTAGEIVPALRGIDLKIPRGQFNALLGPSGSGKTTLLGIVGGLDRADVGEVCVGGVDVGRLSGAALSEFRLRSVGFVFQAAGLIPLMTALENVALPVQLMGRDDAQARELALDALELVGLAGRVRHRAFELSGGEQQRVALARALVKQPQVLLADEPTGQLDSETSAQIVELIASLRGQTTILLATHDEAVAARADRTVYIEDGALKSAEAALS